MTAPSSTRPRIRFIGYPIPTTPAQLAMIGKDQGPGSVVGTYLGHDAFAADVAARVAVFARAVETARAALPVHEDPASVINLFVAPEFYFHGPRGPYIYAPGEPDPVELIRAALVEALPAATYPNWTFVCGTAITTAIHDIERVFGDDRTTVRNAVVETLARQWQASVGPLNAVIFDMLINFIKTCHGYPCLEVRNRALIVSHVGLQLPGGAGSIHELTCEKYFVSNEDFILYDTDGRNDVVTEQMIAYPDIDLSAGDLKRAPFDAHAIFGLDGGEDDTRPIELGVEICLDHADLRLRRNIDNEPWPAPGGGLDVQLIPSCGMQIELASVASEAGGFVFNADGEYGVGHHQPGAPRRGVLAGVDCLYTNYVDPTDASYGGHTQLARVQTAAVGDDPRRPGSLDASFAPLDPARVLVLDIARTPGLDAVFAGGPGQLHIYGALEPYTLGPR